MGNTILVVDDDAMNLKMAEFILKKQGYDVKTVNSGQGCLDYLAEAVVDLVLLDLEMPGMNGIEALEHIRQREELAEIPVAFLSASTNQTDMQKAEKLGAVDFINKPFMPPALLGSVEKILSK